MVRAAWVKVQVKVHHATTSHMSPTTQNDCLTLFSSALRPHSPPSTQPHFAAPPLHTPIMPADPTLVWSAHRTLARPRPVRPSCRTDARRRPRARATRGHSRSHARLSPPTPPPHPTPPHSHPLPTHTRMHACTLAHWPTPGTLADRAGPIATALDGFAGADAQPRGSTASPLANLARPKPKVTGETSNAARTRTRAYRGSLWGCKRENSGLARPHGPHGQA